MTPRNCQARIDAELKGRIADLQKLWNLYLNDSEARDEALGHIHDYALSFDYVAPGTFDGQKEGYFRYQLSWGGPSDEFRIFVNLDFTAHRIEYWFMDWFDGANVVLEGGNLELLQAIYNQLFVESGAVYRTAMEG